MLHFSEIDHIEAYYKDEIPYYDALETYSEQLIFKNKHYEYFSFLFFSISISNQSQIRKHVIFYISRMELLPLYILMQSLFAFTSFNSIVRWTA